MMNSTAYDALMQTSENKLKNVSCSHDRILSDETPKAIVAMVTVRTVYYSLIHLLGVIINYKMVPRSIISSKN